MDICFSKPPHPPFILYNQTHDLAVVQEGWVGRMSACGLMCAACGR